MAWLSDRLRSEAEFTEEAHGPENSEIAVMREAANLLDEMTAYIRLCASNCETANRLLIKATTSPRQIPITENQLHAAE